MAVDHSSINRWAIRFLAPVWNWQRVQVQVAQNPVQRALSRARARIDANLIEEDDFGGACEGWTAEQVWEAVQRLLPLVSDPVVTHGDFSPDNLLISDGDVVGCIDAGRVGLVIATKTSPLCGTASESSAHHFRRDS